MASSEFGLALIALLLSVFACSDGRDRNRGEIEEQIVNGTVAEPGEFPFIVFIWLRDKKKDIWKFCSGSIITERHILTAAHCLFKVDQDRSSVQIGCHNRKYCKDSMKIKRMVLHPHYLGPMNDIALMELKRDINFGLLGGTRRTIPIRLHDLYQKESGHRVMLTITGWGGTDYDPKLTKLENGLRYNSDVLRKIEVPMIPLSECMKNYQGITGSNICAGELGRGQCKGDSGGPVLQRLPSGRLVQVGVVSRSLHCATSAGGVSIRVAAYFDWIVSNLY